MLDDLFGDDSDVEYDQDIPGMTVIKAALDEHTLDTTTSWLKQHFKASNQFMHFGPIHSQLQPIVDLCVKHCSIGRDPLFDQLIANSYEPGEGLVPHVDLLQFDDGIAIASIQGSTTMVFTHPEHNKKSFFLEAGDVVILTGPSRFEWSHGIPCREFDVVDGEFKFRTKRLSLTLRRLKV